MKTIETFAIRNIGKIILATSAAIVGFSILSVVLTLEEIERLQKWQAETTAKADAILEAQKSNPIAKYLTNKIDRRNGSNGFPLSEAAPVFFADVDELELCEIVANGGTGGKPFRPKAKPILFMESSKPETIPANDPDKKNRYLECGPELLDVIEYGLKAPIESKPWRVVHAYEMSHADPVQWGIDVNPRLEALLIGIWPDQQPLTVWEFNRGLKPEKRIKLHPGQVSGTIFHLRQWNGGRQPQKLNAENW